jgi:hypothetical protein
MPAELGGEILPGSKFTLEIVTNTLRIALAAAVEIQHPTMSDRVGDDITMKAAFDGIDDVGHLLTARTKRTKADEQTESDNHEGQTNDERD